MNKKIIITVGICLIVIIGLGFYLNQKPKIQKQKNNKTNINNKTSEEVSSEKTINNIAIIYFSASGTTKKVAETISKETNGELIEIIPKEKYTDKDLDWNDSKSRTSIECNDSKSRPEILNNINVESYDIIYLGYPIWWGDVPHIILTFMDTHNLDGKTIIPFCTSGGTDISGSIKTLKNNNKNVNWIDGKRLSTSENEIINWINNLNY